MSIISQFQKLDNLIIEHTKPPVTPMLRNQLHLAQEELEAYQASSDKQSETLANQIKTIERLVEENKSQKTQIDSMLQELKLKNHPSPVELPKPGLNYNAGKMKRRVL